MTDLLTKLKGTSLQIAKPDIKRAMVVSIEGTPKSGKTTLAFSLPGPIVLLNFDYGEGKPVGDALKAGKEVMKADYNLTLPLGIDRSKADKVKDIYDPVLDRWKNDYLTVVAGKLARTIIIDTASELWELMRLSYFGKLVKVPPHLYVQANAEYRDLIRAGKDAGINVILIHKVRDIWEDNPAGEGRRPKVDSVTGEKMTERSGFGDLGYLVDMSIRTRTVAPVVDKKTVERTVVTGTRFFTDLYEVRDDASLNGSSWEGLDLPALMGMVYPETDWSK